MKAKEKQPEKYHKNAIAKMGDINPCKKYVSTR